MPPSLRHNLDQLTCAVAWTTHAQASAVYGFVQVGLWEVAWMTWKKLPVALTLRTNQLDCFRRKSSNCAVLILFAWRCPVLKTSHRPPTQVFRLTLAGAEFPLLRRSAAICYCQSRNPHGG